MTPETQAAYLDDASLRTLTTEILSYQPISSLTEHERALAKNITTENCAVTTRQTVFYPQGGGQPSDIGTLGPAGDGTENATFKVSLVRKTTEGRILHFGHAINADANSVDSITPPPTTTISPVFSMGDLVVQNIDPYTRNYHSRLHTAGHIIDVAMQLLMPELKNVKANHAPREAALEYEGLLYNDRHKPLIQAKVDELVRGDLPVLISWEERDPDSGSGTGGADGDMEMSSNGLIRIASIGGLDRTPCGGTHVQCTSLVGSISIRKISRQKGVSRISYGVSPEIRE